MSGRGGNMGDYSSSSGYGGGYRHNSSEHADRGVPHYSSRRFGDQYGHNDLGTGNTYGSRQYGGSTGDESSNRGGSGSGTGRTSSAGESGARPGDYSSFERRAANYDRGGYRNRDQNY